MNEDLSLFMTNLNKTHLVYQFFELTISVALAHYLLREKGYIIL